MHTQRTALARFIDMSALWSLCLVSWFCFLAARLRALYPALLLACACAAATIALVMLLRRMIRLRRRGAGLTGAQVRALCGHVALAEPQAALRELAAWLRASGRISSCRVLDGVILARAWDGRETAIALISAWPGEHAGAGDVLAALRRCRAAGAQRCTLVSTAPYAPGAQELARSAGVRLITPEALAEMMLRVLPLCADAGARRPHAPDALRALLTRAHAGRVGAYALTLSIAGRMLGLAYFRAAGLICALIWLLCAAQPRRRSADEWL